jgi:glyoxylase-like metal-dependent hydrolase (beta-lactamase superfamily II)
MANIKAFYDKPTGTVTYLVSDPQTSKAAIIDPLLDFDGASGTLTYTSIDDIPGYARESELIIEWSLETHIHADHLSASDYVRQQTGAKIGVGEKISEVQETFKKHSRPSLT